jgi:hypothetical protein
MRYTLEGRTFEQWLHEQWGLLHSHVSPGSQVQILSPSPSLPLGRLFLGVESISIRQTT